MDIAVDLYAPDAAVDLANEVDQAVHRLQEMPYRFPIYQTLYAMKHEVRFFPLKNGHVFTSFMKKAKPWRYGACFTGFRSRSANESTSHCQRQQDGFLLPGFLCGKHSFQEAYISSDQCCQSSISSDRMISSTCAFRAFICCTQAIGSCAFNASVTPASFGS